MSLASAPYTLWHLYLDNLVNYKSGSWVHSIASTCRILAFAAIIPFILLTLLDVASYVIARTLGVIDETRASTTGDHVTPDLQMNTDKGQPTIVVEDPDTARAAATPLPPDEGVDGNPKLSGVDAFSPAPSQPGSPTLQRREFMQHQHAHYGSYSSLYDRGGRAGGENAEKHASGDGDGGSGAATPRDFSAGSSSGESSYAILDRDSGSGSEDAGVVLRRRTRQTGTGSDRQDGAES